MSIVVANFEKYPERVSSTVTLVFPATLVGIPVIAPVLPLSISPKGNIEGCLIA